MQSLSCNLCRQNPDGLIYKTACNHLFCVSCAKSSFETRNICPFCNALLKLGDVQEVSIGLASASPGAGMVVGVGVLDDCVATVESLCSMACCQSPAWPDIVRNLDLLNGRMLAANRFFMKQLLIDQQGHKAQLVQRENEVLTLKMQMQEIAGKLDKKERELAQMGESLNDATRKCTAWSKAYDNIRDQLLAMRPHQGQGMNQQPLSKLMRRTSSEITTTFHHGPSIMDSGPGHQHHQLQQQLQQPEQQHQQQIQLPYAMHAHPPQPRFINSLPCSFFET